MTANQVRISPFFLNGGPGPLFCIYLAPTDGPIAGQILYLHPFAEEMHKSRRMAALQARRFAAAGYAVLQVDLSGCGDSWGDFSDAVWGLWLEDAACAVAWLREKNADLPLLFWGCRLGATLAIDLAARSPKIHGAILWQPVINGELFINQFLRIKLASEMLTEGRTRIGVRELREQLKRGASVEVGGYRLVGELANAIANLHIGRMTPPRRVIWIEVSADSQGTTSPVSQNVISGWVEQGCTVIAKSVEGEPFWMTQEIAVCPLLLDATMSALHRMSP